MRFNLCKPYFWGFQSNSWNSNTYLFTYLRQVYMAEYQFVNCTTYIYKRSVMLGVTNEEKNVLGFHITIRNRL